MASFDYSMLNKQFAKIVSERLGLTLVELNGGGKQPEGTFVAFDIISPYIPIDEYFDLDDEQAFEAVVSFTVFDIKKTNALKMAQQLRRVLTQFDVALELNDNSVIVVEIMPTNIRSIVEDVVDKHMVGFDVRLRLLDNYKDETIDQIDLVNLQKGEID